jgi:hypothetical protein
MNTFARVSSQFSVVAVSAHDPRPRAPMASAGSSDARTQGGDKGSALALTEDAAARRSGAASGVRGRGERVPNLCQAPQVASVKMAGQNGKNANANAVIQTPCGSKGRAKTGKRHSQNRRANPNRRAGR